jgi:hypothetical protein
MILSLPNVRARQRVADDLAALPLAPCDSIA